MTYWDQHNPWNEKAVYVPIGELAECLSSSPVRFSDGSVVEKTAEQILNNWKSYGDKLDAYVLPNINNPEMSSIGVRYGGEGHQYISVYNSNVIGVVDLVNRHSELVVPPKMP